MTGKVIGTYQIVQQLGQGLHGTVYQAVEGRGQTVTLKAIQPALAQQVTFKQNLRALAATVTSMRHPHLAAFHTILQMGNELYVIGEFVKGMPLNETLQRAGVLACAEATRLAAQVLDVLAYAHAAGVWHWGIKPSNLMLTADRQIKLTDLGLAQAAGPGLLRDGLGASVFNYVAPEQLRGEACDARTDVYAMGAVLYEMLTGLPPFRRANDAALRQAHLAETPPSPRNYFPLIPLPLEQAVLRALAKSPTERFSSAKAFRLALLSWADEAQTAGVEAEIIPRAGAAQGGYSAAASAAPLLHEPRPASFATAAPTPLAPNDWPQFAPPTGAGKPSATSSVASTGLNDEVVVELEEPTSGKRGFWKPLAAVTGVAALLGATYALVRVNTSNTPPPDPNQIAIRVSPTLPPPAQTPTAIAALTETTPVPQVLATPKINAAAKPQLTKSPRPLPAAPAPKLQNKPAAKANATLAPPKIAKAKPTPTTLAAKKKPAPTPTPANDKNGKKKNGGTGGFLKGIFSGGGKEKKTASTPKPKKAESMPKPKKY